MVASQSCVWTDADLSAVTGISAPASSTTSDAGDWSVYARVIRDGRANLAYREYQSIYAVYGATTAELTGQHNDSPRCGVADQFVVTATRLSITFAVSAFTASRLLGEAIAAQVRTPKTALLLRDAVISPEVFRQIVLRTDCVLDPDLLAIIDTEIAAELRRLGAISRGRAKAVADRMVARHDPDGVRERRAQAREARCVYTTNTDDGMAELTVIADAENARLALLALDVLIGGVCPNDPRSKGQLRSDAATDTADDATHVGREATDHGTTGAENAAAEQNPAANDTPGTRPRRLLRAPSRPADPYRPTTASDAIVRFLHGACTVPGCDQPAWMCDLDHAEEFDHLTPWRGGPTCWCNLAPKCRAHHLIKTYGTAFLDDQYRDTAGQFIVGYTIPDGYTTETVALNHWLFPELNTIDCEHESATGPTPDITEPPPTTYSPTRAKHARRRAERARNRERRRAEREQLDRDLGPPPFWHSGLLDQRHPPQPAQEQTVISTPRRPAPHTPAAPAVRAS
ncbi:MAG: DUF222 domain-containing protein [Gordonia sp. (in: high G+C Gram-positive bacteria)]